MNARVKQTSFRSRRRAMAGLGAVVAIALGVAIVIESRRGLPPTADAGAIVVYKDAGCRCCTKWVDHLRRAGFSVAVENRSDMAAVKRDLGVPSSLASCHTAQVDGYVIEGHVPAEDIRALLARRPDADGLAAPGMPVGSPGMESGSRIDRYDVLLFASEGDPSVFATHGAQF